MPAVHHDKAFRKQVAKYRVRYRDIFDMKKFYKDVRYWLNEHNWTDLEDKTEHWETFYLEKIDMAGFTEIWIKWRPQKIPQQNSYYRYWLDFDFHIIGMKEAQIVREGKKFKVDKGDMDLNVTAWIDLDYDNKWSSHPILKFFNKIFPERIFRKEIYDDHKRELYREAYELQNFIKQWFKLKRYLPYEETESFYAPNAWQSHTEGGE